MGFSGRQWFLKDFCGEAVEFTCPPQAPPFLDGLMHLLADRCERGRTGIDGHVDLI
jgi:hypothetical protein